MRLIPLLTLTYSYELLKDIIPVFPKVLGFCEEVDNIVIDTAYEITKNIPNFYLGEENTGEICMIEDKKINNYGYMSWKYNTNFTRIMIHRDLLYTPNTLYNVLLHEVLHSFGLNHSNIEGMMNYTVSVSRYGRVIEDERKLWISYDDIMGLNKLYFDNI